MRSPAVNLITPVNWQHPLNRGLEAWYLVMPGNNGGSKWVDITKHGHDGTLTNMDTAKAWKGASRPGGWGALDFDGTSYIEVTSAKILPNTIGSISFWANPDTVGTAVGAFVSINDGTADNRVSVYLGASGTKFLVFVKGGGVGANVWEENDPGSILSNSKMQLITLTFDTVADDYNVYIDGSLKTADSTANAGNPAGINQVNIGSFWDASVNYDGLLDDIRIWSRALPASEIKSLYNDSRAGYLNTLNWIKRRLPVTAAGGTIAGIGGNSGGIFRSSIIGGPAV